MRTRSPLSPNWWATAGPCSWCATCSRCPSFRGAPRRSRRVTRRVVIAAPQPHGRRCAHEGEVTGRRGTSTASRRWASSFTRARRTAPLGRPMARRRRSDRRARPQARHRVRTGLLVSPCRTTFGPTAVRSRQPTPPADEGVTDASPIGRINGLDASVDDVHRATALRSYIGCRDHQVVWRLRRGAVTGSAAADPGDTSPNPRLGSPACCCPTATGRRISTAAFSDRLGSRKDSASEVCVPSPGALLDDGTVDVDVAAARLGAGGLRRPPRNHGVRSSDPRRTHAHLGRGG